MATELPAWVDESGLPTGHAVRAAIHVAVTIDERGSRVVDTYESYWHKATGGVLAPPDLALGQRLLIDCGLVEEREGTLYPQPALHQILLGTSDDALSAVYVSAVKHRNYEAVSAHDVEKEIAALIPDPARREELLLALGRHFDDAHRRLVGEIGEELVVAALRADLEGLGYPDLARAVRHLSLESDMLGYDISAPRIGGPVRFIEVKATTAPPEQGITFYVSRNEADTGLKYQDWALVVCAVIDAGTREGEIIGWQSAAALAPAFPVDSPGGRWESTALTIATSDLVPGLPPAVT